MEITKETMEQEARAFLKILFDLPEIEKIAIKDIMIESPDDEQNIRKGLELCYHDNYSDIDFNAWVRLNPQDFNGETPIYRNYFPRLKIQDKILGIAFQERMDQVTNKEGMRIVLKSGIRMDFTCFTRCDASVSVLPQESRLIKESVKKEDNFWEDWDLEKVDSFWFNAVFALGKLMRGDYLIASHLAHMILMEGLVVQMIRRDNEYHTNFHRYGYSETLDYLTVNLEGANEFKVPGNDAYNHIVDIIFQAVISYDRLIPSVNDRYQSRRKLFMNLWRSYFASYQ